MMRTITAPLQGKIAIVSGGSRGIGAGIVQKFAEYGCAYIATTYNTNKAKAEEILAKCRDINPQIQTYAMAADCCDPDFGRKVIAQSMAGLGVNAVDILVSSAAYADAEELPPIEDLEKATWDKFITANAWGPLVLAREVIEFMPQGGRIVMLSSGASKTAHGDRPIAYAASKAALDAVSRNLAAAWGVSRGVTVNTISIGATDTDALQKGFASLGPEFIKRASEFSLLRRIGTVEEVANIVTFVASPEASWLTGNQIPANGGGLSVLQS